MNDERSLLRPSSRTAPSSSPAPDAPLPHDDAARPQAPAARRCCYAAAALPGWQGICRWRAKRLNQRLPATRWWPQPCRCYPTAQRNARDSAQHPNPSGLRGALIEVGEAPSSAKAQARRACRKEQVIGVALHPVHASSTNAPPARPGAVRAPGPAQSLLVHFHNESWGGEKVFRADSAKLAENVAAQRNAAGAAARWCLALGFEGRYRVHRQRQGPARQRPRAPGQPAAPAGGATVESELSPQWQGVACGKAKPAPTASAVGASPRMAAGTAAAAVHGAALHALNGAHR